jgi:hypothetical protein
VCKAPKAPEIKIPEPKILSNPFLDDARSDSALVSALRTGRSSLRIPLNTGLGIGFAGREGTSARTATGGPRGNAGTAAPAGIGIN